MTIAAGFLCENGIVICADSEVNTDVEKYEESKIFTLHTDSSPTSPTAIIAGSGWLDFVKMAVDKIRKQTVFAATGYEIQEVIEQTILEVHRKHIRYYPGEPKPYFDLVVAIRDGDGLRLLKTSRTSVVHVTDFACIGIGDTLANYLSRALNPQRESSEDAAVLAVQILDQVKNNVSGCGGRFSEISVLPKEGQILRVPPSSLLDIEYRARDFAPLLKPLLMSISNPNSSGKDFEASLSAFVQECRHIREESQERMRRARNRRKV